MDRIADRAANGTSARPFGWAKLGDRAKLQKPRWPFEAVLLGQRDGGWAENGEDEMAKLLWFVTKEDDDYGQNDELLMIVPDKYDEQFAQETAEDTFYWREVALKSEITLAGSDIPDVGAYPVFTN